MKDEGDQRELVRNQASHCAITGLLNRREFERRFELERADTRHVLMLIDLQGVFGINTDHGWKAGDEVLRRVAALIRSTVGECGLAGRVGGCHFMALLNGVPRQRGVEIAEELGRTIVGLRVDWQGVALRVAAWIGVVEIGDESPGFTDCWLAASVAAQASKTEGHASGEHAGFRVCTAEIPLMPGRAVDPPSAACAASEAVGDPPDLLRQIAYQASHDALTGLLNRREFERRLQESIEAAHVGGQRVVLCYLDLDRFKAVNDECGHMAGDRLLVEVAAVIQGAVRDGDTVARLGGDEFGVLLSDCTLDTARQVAEGLVRAVGDHRFVWEDRIFQIGVSVGLVEVPLESGSLEDVVEAADVACCVAKMRGDHVQVLSAREEAVARQRGDFRWLQAFTSSFELHTQRTVVVDGENRLGPGLEVILRVKDENGATVETGELLRVAERYRLMPHVDRWVVQTALEALGRGAVQLPEGRSLIIPLSGQSLGDAAFLDFVVDCLDSTGVAPERICFEVTEQSVVSNLEHARRFIGVLHTMGCWFVLGELNLGGHTFPNLSHLPFDYLRIDSELLRDVAAGRMSRTMFDALIGLGRGLGLRIIASQVDPPRATEDVVAVAIDWEMGGETLLQLEVDADGSIRRAGDGTSSVANQSLAAGRSDEPLLSRILAGMSSELLRIAGVTLLGPFAGKLGKLSVHFRRRDGGGRAFEVWYGSASAGPSAAIMEFVAHATRVTDAWYARMQPGTPRT